MSDRELLEKAARAAGLDVEFLPMAPGRRAMFWHNHVGEWNPLTDDGDAFRLAVRLRLDCLFDGEDSPNAHIEVVANLPCDGKLMEQPWAAEPLRTDPYAATRRAIVRAAAAMDKGE